MSSVKNILAHYSPEDVSILIAGFVTISGLSDGSFITISKDQQNFVTKTSSDGEVSRTHTGGRTYNLSLVLHSTSSSNQAMSYLAAADDITKMAKFPIIVKDTLGGTLLFAPTAWIEGIPDTVFSTEITEREWIIKCANATLNIGGNESSSGFVEDLLNVGVGSLGGIL